MKKAFTLSALILISSIILAQTGSLKGRVTSNGKPVEDANIVISKTKLGTSVIKDGSFEINSVAAGTYQVIISAWVMKQ